MVGIVRFMLLEVAGLLLGLSDHICPVATRRGHYSVAIVATASPAFSRRIQAVTAMPNANTLANDFHLGACLLLYCDAGICFAGRARRDGGRRI